MQGPKVVVQRSPMSHGEVMHGKKCFNDVLNIVSDGWHLFNVVLVLNSCLSLIWSEMLEAYATPR